MQVVADAPDGGRHLPRVELTVTDQLEHLLFAPLVVQDQLVSPLAGVRKWPAVRRQDERRAKAHQVLKPGQVVVQRVGRALRVQSDVWALVRQEMVTGEE